MITEDDKETLDYLEEVFVGEGYSVLKLLDAKNFLEKVDDFMPDVVLLDLHLPGGITGVDLIKKLRSHSKSRFVPIIMISGDDEEEAKVISLQVGADDYIVKPLNPRELLARVGAVLRRSHVPEEISEVELNIGKLKIDLKSHRIFNNSEEVYLTLTEYKILVELIRERGKVLSRDILRERSLGNLNVTDRTIDVHMTSLRKKIDLCAQSIKTIRGVGYRFN